MFKPPGVIDGSKALEKILAQRHLGILKVVFTFTAWRRVKRGLAVLVGSAVHDVQRGEIAAPSGIPLETDGLELVPFGDDFRVGQNSLACDFVKCYRGGLSHGGSGTDEQS